MGNCGAPFMRAAAYGLSDESIADVAIGQEAVIEAHKVTDWETNLDLQKQMRRDLDEVPDVVELKYGALFDSEQLDLMIDRLIEVAKARSNGRGDE